jgi:TRAP-type mannitol/chloroaromatic compound transport system permease small subunit
MRKLKAALRIIDKISEWTANIVSWLVVAIVAVTVYEVVLRYFFNAPTRWAFEFNYLAYGPYFILLGAYVFATGNHVNVDIIYGRFSVRQRAIMDICTFPFFFFLTLMMLIYGGRFAANSWAFRETLSSAWAPPIYPIKMAIPVGAALLLLQGLAKLVRDLYIAFTGEEHVL